MNWGAFAWWTALVVLVALVAYLEFGWGRVRDQRTEQPDPATEVTAASVLTVRCSDCGDTLDLGVAVATGDGRQHVAIGLSDIVAAVNAHRARHHRAIA